MARANLILRYAWLLGAVAILIVYSRQRSDVSETDRQSWAQSFVSSVRDTVTLAVQKTGSRTNQSAIDLIKKRVGLRLKAYTSPAGGWLIGYGHATNVTPDMTVTETEAEAFLRKDLVTIEQEIKTALKVPVNANEFSAMVVLAYNIGKDQFATSSVLRKFNQADKAAAADAFLMWNKSRRDGQLVTDPYLADQRVKERELFLKPVD